MRKEPIASIANNEINCDNRDMREVFIDCSDISSMQEFWQRYLDVAKPDGAAIFGRNLDAFWDAIDGGGPGYPGEVSLIVTNSARLAGLLTQDGSVSFLDALKAIADKASTVSVKFVD